MTQQEYIASLRLQGRVKILFVCLGNICRSPAAEGVTLDIVDRRELSWHIQVDSAGIGAWHTGQLPDRRMRSHAAARGITLTHRARQVQPGDFDKFDLIIGMDDENIADLQSLARNDDDRRKIVPMAQWLDPEMGYKTVPDPYYQDDEAFDLVLDLLEVGCQRLIDDISEA